MLIQHRDRLSRRVKKVGGDPQDAVGTRPGRSSPMLAPFDMGRRLHFHHADRMVRAILARARLPDRHDLIPEHSSGQIVFREFTGLNALDSAVVPNAADIAALRSHDLVEQ